MKKFAPIAAIALFAIAFTSCKKDYTCECTVLGTTVPTEFKDVKKKDAQDDCDKLDASAKIVDGNCKLK